VLENKLSKPILSDKASKLTFSKKTKEIWTRMIFLTIKRSSWTRDSRIREANSSFNSRLLSQKLMAPSPSSKLLRTCVKK